MCRKNLAVACVLLSVGAGLLLSLVLSSSFFITLLGVVCVAVGLILIKG